MRIFKFIALSGLVIWLIGCHPHHKSGAGSAQMLKIDVAPVCVDTLTIRYRFTTHLAPHIETSIQPRVNGYLIRKAYADGGFVKRGELLFEIETSLLLTTLRSAEASLAAAEAEQITARNNYERALPLARLEAISSSQLDAYRASYASAEGQVKAAREQVANTRLQVSYARICAPIDGIVAQSKAHQGDYVGPGTQFPSLTTIVATDTLTADIAIPTSLYIQNSGHHASDNNASLLSDIRLILANGEQYPYAGEYDFTRQSITPTAGTVTIVVKFPNPDLRLKAGEYGEVECGIGPRRRVITIPQRAVQTLQDRHSVWVIGSDSVAHWREVTLGEAFAGRWIVEQGLTEGEQVAIVGGQKLREGEKVSPQKQK